VSRSLNKVQLIGNLGSDPEIRTTGGGQQVAQFNVATTRQWSNAQGEKQEKTEWHRIVAWRKLAEIAERFLKKGDRVYIEGEIQYREYEAKDGGGKRYVTEIEAREMIMLGGREGGGGGGGGFERESSAPRARSGAGGGGGGGRGGAPAGGGGYDGFEAPAFEEDDDLPF
jgi:single-strand DNA-binding protein